MSIELPDVVAQERDGGAAGLDPVHLDLQATWESAFSSKSRLKKILSTCPTREEASTSAASPSMAAPSSNVTCPLTSSSALVARTFVIRPGGLVPHHDRACPEHD